MPNFRNHVKYYIGIDIGIEGAIVVQNSENHNVVIDVMPKIADLVDLHKLNKLLSVYKVFNCHVVFEDLRSIYGASAGSNFTFGGNVRSLEALCIANDLPFTPIRAEVWQKESFVGVKEIMVVAKGRKSGFKRDTKAMAELAAKRLHPTVNLLNPDSKRSYKPHKGIVDALLISDYAKKHFT